MAVSAAAVDGFAGADCDWLVAGAFDAFELLHGRQREVDGDLGAARVTTAAAAASSAAATMDVARGAKTLSFSVCRLASAWRRRVASGRAAGLSVRPRRAEGMTTAVA